MPGPRMQLDLGTIGRRARDGGYRAREHPRVPAVKRLGTLRLQDDARNGHNHTNFRRLFSGKPKAPALDAGAFGLPLNNRVLVDLSC